MTRLLSAVIVLQLALAGVAYGEGDDAAAVLARLEAKFQGLQTFQATGEATSSVTQGSQKFQMRCPFSLKLKRPNFYLITWKTQMPFGPGGMDGAIWNAGAGPYLYMGLGRTTYCKMESDALAIAAATGVSSMTANQVPSLFFSFEGLPRLMDALESPQLLGPETVEGQLCDVVQAKGKKSATEMMGASLTWKFWISKESGFLVKSEMSAEKAKGTTPPKLPEISDAQIEQALKAMGAEVTDASKQRMREAMKSAAQQMPPGDMAMVTVITYKNVKADAELADKDFEYGPAKTATQVSSFAEMVGGFPGAPAGRPQPKAPPQTPAGGK